MMETKEINIKITAITSENREEKYLKAMTAIAKAMGQPLTVRSSVNTEDGEAFVWKAQDQWVTRWHHYFAHTLDQVYLTVCNYLGLPIVTTFIRKSHDNDPLILRGTVLFNPETGRPLKQADFNKLIGAIEKFLNRKLTDVDRKIVLGSDAIGRIISQLMKRNTAEAVRQFQLEQLKPQRGYSFDALSDNLKTFNEVFKPSTEELERLRMAADIMGERIVSIKQEALLAIREVYSQGVMQRQSGQQIAQNLFEKCGGLNRDWRRIVETESAELTNNAYLRAEMAESSLGEKVYFQRHEALDGHQCRYCASIKDSIALWSDVPLTADGISDPYGSVAIWEGKSNALRSTRDYWLPAGPCHPHCRGSWIRWNPPKSGLDAADMAALSQRMADKSRIRGQLYTQAYQEAATELMAQTGLDESAVYDSPEHLRLTNEKNEQKRAKVGL